VRLKAYGKVNLSLKVLGRRPDGFHEIESVMQSISLYDLITLTPLDQPGIRLTVDNPSLPNDRENLAYRAAELFYDKFPRSLPQGVQIALEKKIPLAAGLAGGSADAAAVIFGLNELLPSNRRLDQSSLLNLGAELGSDIPFCLTGGTCRVGGRGEKVEKLTPWPKRYFLLVYPELRISSKWAYEQWDAMPNIEIPGGPEGFGNDLEAPIVAHHEVISDLKRRLTELGCSYAQMSGSGSTVFGVVTHRETGEVILNKMIIDYPCSYLVEEVGRGVELEKDGVGSN
jgi:4-diphosphocytidyl-2-C-methyl-D-erythritol kinase